MSAISTDTLRRTMVANWPAPPTRAAPPSLVGDAAPFVVVVVVVVDDGRPAGSAAYYACALTEGVGESLGVCSASWSTAPATAAAYGSVSSSGARRELLYGTTQYYRRLSTST